jgi:hypothetical protein
MLARSSNLLPEQNMPLLLIGLEACSDAHFLGRAQTERRLSSLLGILSAAKTTFGLRERDFDRHVSRLAINKVSQSHPMTGKFVGYEHRLDDPHSLSDNRVTSGRPTQRE